MINGFTGKLEESYVLYILIELLCLIPPPPPLVPPQKKVHDAHDWCTPKAHYNHVGVSSQPPPVVEEIYYIIHQNMQYLTEMSTPLTFL